MSKFDQLLSLKGHTFHIQYEDGKSSIHLSRKSSKKLIGVLVMILSVLMLFFSLFYLIEYADFKPILFRLGIGFGFMFFLLGNDIRTKNGRKAVRIHLSEKYLKIGKKKFYSNGISQFFLVNTLNKTSLMMRFNQHDVVVLDRVTDEGDKHLLEEVLKVLSTLVCSKEASKS